MPAAPESYRSCLPPDWQAYADRSAPALPAQPLPQADAVARWAPLCGLDASTTTALLAMTRRVEAEPALAELFRLLGGATQAAPAPARDAPFDTDPQLERFLREDEAGLLLLLVPLAACPQAEALYRLRALPPELLPDTLDDMRVWSDHHRANRGVPGLTWRIVRWLRHHLAAEVLRFGRLQAEVEHSFAGKVVVLRRDSDGATAMLAESGMLLRADGRLADDRTPPAEQWTTQLEEGADGLCGHPVPREGLVLRERRHYARRDGWTVALRRGDPAINLHIPALGPLTAESCLDAFRRIRAFCAGHAPARADAPLVCYSWMLDSQLGGLLAPDANLLRFQRLGHLFPHENTAETVFRVFGEKAVREGVASVAPASSLQRACAEFLARGGRFQTGGMLCFPAPRGL